MPQKLVTATNPETNENIVLVDGEWKPYTQSATDKSGRAAFLVDNKWVAEEAPPPTYGQKVLGSAAKIAREVVNPVLAPYATAGGAGFAAGGPIGSAIALGGLAAGDIATSLVGMKTPSQAIRELYGDEIIGEPTSQGTRALRTVGEFAVPASAGSRVAETFASGVRPTADLTADLARQIEFRQPANAIENYLLTTLGKSQQAPVGPGTTQNVLSVLAKNPSMQTTSAAAGGAAVAGTEYLGGDPYAQLAAGLVGGMVPSIAAAGTKAVGQRLYSLTEPLSKAGLERVRSRALLESFNNDPMRLQAAIDMLESGMTPEQVAVRTNNSSFASLLATTRYAKPNVSDMYRARDTAINQRMENELVDVNRRLANEAGRLESQAIILPRGVPGADQPRMGRQITVAREQEIEKVRREVVRPAYEAAFNAAPDSFNIEPVIIAARQIESDPLTRLNPGLAEKTSQILSEYKFTMPKDVDAGFGSVGGERPPARPVPPQVTLEGADSIIKAINMDVAKLLGKTDSESVKTLSNLYKLRSAVDESIKAGVPEKANSLYKEALNLYQTRIAAPFREGWVANLEREGATGVQMVAPAKVVSTIINPADPDNARRFVLALGDNKRAMAATKAGILDLYKQKVVKGAKIAPEDHEKFMRDHAAALGILDNAGMGIRAELNKFGKVATSVEGRRSRLEDLTRYVNEKTAGLTATPEQSARNVTAAALDEPGVRQVVDEINRTLNDQRAFVKLVNDASRSSGVGPGKIVAQDRELPPFLDSNVMLANWIIARLKGKLDTKQAADLAVELLNSNTAARALGNALEERVSVFGTKRKAYQRGAVGEALFSPYKFPPALAITPQVPAAISREDRNKLRREEQNRNALAR
jgi:hypothetical protein